MVEREATEGECQEHGDVADDCSSSNALEEPWSIEVEGETAEYEKHHAF